MEKRLKMEVLAEATARNGLNQSAIADALQLTRASVSKWFTGKAFPRPPELLRLGKLLQLGYGDLVETAPDPADPVIAFRKRAHTKTKDVHVAHAKEMGRLLEPIVPHLPFDRFVGPRRLKNPSLDYGYLQGLVAELRRELRLDAAGPIKFEDLIGKFRELDAVIIPVMWGQRLRHENALHVYLPESKTTWIYVNLDSHLHDFKFWMAHELGHLLSVELLEKGKTDLAEDFADAFAGALLFPKPAAKSSYSLYENAGSSRRRLNAVLAAAEQYVISPYSIYKEIENYARTHGLPFTELPAGQLHATIAAFNKRYASVSEMLFDRKIPSADHYMRIGEKAFKTPFFNSLGQYLKTSTSSESIVSRMLDIPLLDAKELRTALL